MRTLTAVVLSMGLATIATTARADGDAQIELQRRFDEAVKFLNQGKYEEARIRFAEACAVIKTPNCPKNLAYVEQKLGLWVDAATHYREFIDDPRAKEDAAYGEAQAAYLEALGKVGEVDFQSTTEGARVRIDGKLVGTTPITHAVFVNVGPHDIEAQWPLSLKKTKIVSEAGKATNVVLAPEGTTTSVGVPSKPGMVTGPITRTEYYRPLAGYVVPGVLLGLAMVGLGTGIGLSVASQSAETDRTLAYSPYICANRASAGCIDYEAKVSSVNGLTTGAIVSYVTSGVLLAAAVVAFVVWPKAERTVTITPTVGIGHAGLQLGGSF